MIQTNQDLLLVQECLSGSEDAWKRLIDKYKNLIFSIPIKYGFTPTDATDIFQSVCLTLLSEMPRLREPQSLAAWLIQTTSHTCFRWRDRATRESRNERQSEQISQKLPEQALQEMEREQILRDTLTELSSDCKQLVDLLFFPPRQLSYDEVAQSLGIPKGSIGPTRIRCLKKLRQILERKGFEVAANVRP